MIGLRTEPGLVAGQPSLVIEVDAHEGPVYSSGEDALYFTSVPKRDAGGRPRVAIKRLQLDGERFPLEATRLTTVRHDANVANGMFLDRDGRLVVCEQGSFVDHPRISRVDRSTGASETAVDHWGKLRFNSPNDVVVRSDGTIWFTDPSYGSLQGFRPQPELPDLVWRYDPATDWLTLAAGSFDKPNGLAFSPDERVLYVTDNGAPHHIVAFDVAPNGRLVNRRRLAAGTPGHPDGLKVDAAGRIFASSQSGIQVFAPGGRLLGEIPLPGAVNFTFGGVEGNVLFITAETAIWAVQVDSKGAF